MISDKVVTLQGRPVTDAELPTYDLGLVEMLDEIVLEIKRGEVNGLAVAILRPNDVVSTRISGNSLRLLAGSARLYHRIQRDCDELEITSDPRPTPVPDGA
jgi:hypothetical protein